MGSKAPPAKPKAGAQGKPAASASPRRRYKPGEPRPPRGPRPLYTPQLAEELCGRIARGETLESICQDDHMPSPSTIWTWISDSRPAVVPATFSDDYARARMVGFDAIAAETMQIADTALMGDEVTVKADGSREVKTGDMLGHRKLQIDTRRWLLSKWDPRRYGEKMAVGGADDLPAIKTESSAEEVARRIAFALQRGLAAQKETS